MGGVSYFAEKGIVSILSERTFGYRPIKLGPSRSAFQLKVARAYKSRTDRPMKTKIGTEVAHVTCDSDTTFKVKRSKVNLQGRGIVAASRTACLKIETLGDRPPIS